MSSGVTTAFQLLVNAVSISCKERYGRLASLIIPEWPKWVSAVKKIVMAPAICKAGQKIRAREGCLSQMMQENSLQLAPRLCAGAVMALAAAAPGWFLWKHFPPLLIVFLGCGLLIGGAMVGGALASNRSAKLIALRGAATALLSFPVVGFFVGFGEACVGGGLNGDCVSVAGGLSRMVSLVVEEAAKSVAPIALVGALAALLARWLWRTAFQARPLL